MIKSLTLSVLFHGALFAVGYQLVQALPVRPTIFYVEPVWELDLEGKGDALAMPSQRIEAPTEGAESVSRAQEHARSGSQQRAGRKVRLVDFVAGNGNKAPAYPEEARARGWEGEVSLAIRFIDQAPEVVVVRSSGHQILDEAAVETAKEWRLTEALLQGDERHFEVPFEFRLRSANAGGGE